MLGMLPLPAPRAGRGSDRVCRTVLHQSRARTCNITFRHPAARARLRRQHRASLPIVLELIPEHLAAVALRETGYDEHLLGCFLHRQTTPTVLGHSRCGELGAGTRHDIAYDLFALDRIRHADGCSIENSGMPEQALIDLQPGDVDAATDDKVLCAPAHVNEAILVHDCEVAGLDALSADRLDRAVLTHVPDRTLTP